MVQCPICRERRSEIYPSRSAFKQAIHLLRLHRLWRCTRCGEQFSTWFWDKELPPDDAEDASDESQKMLNY